MSDLDRLDQALGARRRTIRGWSQSARSGWIFSCRDWMRRSRNFSCREQLSLARRHGLPVILHVRRSADQLLKHLRPGGVSGIAHAFNGSMQQAREFVRLGFKLGFGGTVTFERALQMRRLATQLPLEALVLETDAPDIPPHWLYCTAEQRAAGQRQRRNEPARTAAHRAGAGRPARHRPG